MRSRQGASASRGSTTRVRRCADAADDGGHESLPVLHCLSGVGSRWQRGRGPAYGIHTWAEGQLTEHGMTRDIKLPTTVGITAKRITAPGHVHLDMRHDDIRVPRFLVIPMKRDMLVAEIVARPVSKGITAARWFPASATAG
jgi:hypothetical protein